MINIPMITLISLAMHTLHETAPQTYMRAVHETTLAVKEMSMTSMTLLALHTQQKTARRICLKAV